MRRTIVTIGSVCMLLGACSPASAGGFWDRLRGERGSGDMVTRERQISDFTIIESNAPVDLYVTVGQPTSLKITFDDNLIDLIDTEVHGSTLEISSRESYRSRHGCRIDLTVANLEEIVWSSSGDLEISGFDNNDFELDLSGSGDFWLSGKTGHCIIRISGSGDGTIEGEANDLDVKISGSGSLDAHNLRAVKARTRVSGSGSIKVQARDELEASVTGSGAIVYYGKPGRLDTNVSGSGSIRRK